MRGVGPEARKEVGRGTATPPARPPPQTPAARMWAPILARLATDAVAAVDPAALLADAGAAAAPLDGLRVKTRVAPGSPGDSRCVPGVALRGVVASESRPGGGATRVAVVGSDLRGGDAGVALARVAASHAGAQLLIIAGDAAPDAVAALGGAGVAVVARTSPAAARRAARAAGAPVAPDAASLRPEHVFDAGSVECGPDDGDGRALVSLAPRAGRALSATLVLSGRGGRPELKRVAAAARVALAVAWRARAEGALLADSLAAAGAAAGWLPAAPETPLPPAAVTAYAGAVAKAAAASAAAAAKERDGRPIAAGTPHAACYDSGEPPSTPAPRLRLWTSAATAAPTTDLAAPCAPAAVVRYDFFCRAPPDAPPYARDDACLASLLAGLWARTVAAACGAAGCTAHPAEHARAFSVGAARVTLTAGRLAPGDALPDGAWWLWRVPPGAACGGGGGRRVPLSPAAATASGAALLELLFGADALAVPVKPGSAGVGGALRGWDLCVGAGRAVARFAHRPLDVPSLAPPAGPITPDPVERAAWLRGEVGRLVADVEAALASLAAAAGDAGAARAPAALPTLRAALAADRTPLEDAVHTACSAVDAACATAGGDADGAAAATVAAVGALATARRTLAKVGAAWAARLADEELLGRLQAECSGGGGGGAATPNTPAPDDGGPPPSLSVPTWVRAAAAGPLSAAGAVRRWLRPVAADADAASATEGGASSPPTPRSDAEGDDGERGRPEARGVPGSRRGSVEATGSPRADAGLRARLAAAFAPALSALTRRDAGGLTLVEAPLQVEPGAVRAALAATPSAAALARLRDAPPTLAPDESAAGVFALPGGRAVRVGGRGLLPPPRGARAPPSFVRDDDAASIVAYFIAGDAHVAFVVGHARILASAAAAAAAAAAGDAAAARDPRLSTPAPTPPPDPDPHFEAALTDDAPGPDAGRAELRVRAWCAPQFAALRAALIPGGDASYAASLSATLPWAPAGGKSGAAFARSADGCLVVKAVRRGERAAFVDLAPALFRRAGEAGGGGPAAAHPCFLSRILGVYTVSLLPPPAAGGGPGPGLPPARASTVDLVVMENLFRGPTPPRALFDLKGVDARGDTGGVGGSTMADGDLAARVAAGAAPPLAAADHVSLTSGLAADAAMLAAAGVMDYSLLAGLVIGGGEARGGGGGARDPRGSRDPPPTTRLVVGVVDFLRRYTWDKRVERWAKAAAAAVAAPPPPPRAAPADPGAPAPGAGTVQAPAAYAARFVGALGSYFAAVPSWADPPATARGGGSGGRLPTL